MARRVLVTMTNLLATAKTGVAIVDLDDGSIEPVSLGWDLGTERCTGVAVTDDYVYVIFESHLQWMLATLSRDTLDPVTVVPVVGVSDPHSIAVFHGSLFVVATGTDEILEYGLDGSTPPALHVFWQAGPERKDQNHLNSLAVYDGELVVSGFGPRTAELWSSAVNGFIKTVPDERAILKDLEHPHSVAPRGDTLAVCESQRKAVRVVNGPTVTAGGYTRGLAWVSEEQLVVGESIGRRISKSTGRIANPADPGETSGRCGLSLVDIRRLTSEPRADLSALGPEIYDVMVLD